MAQRSFEDVVFSGASPSQQPLDAGVVDELVVHLAPSLIGSGIRLFDSFKGLILLEKIYSSDGPMATHVLYHVSKADSENRHGVERRSSIRSDPPFLRGH